MSPQIIVISPRNPNNERGFSTEAQARRAAQSLLDNKVALPFDGVLKVEQAAPGTYNSSYRPDPDYFPFQVSWTESILNEDTKQHEKKNFSVNAGIVVYHMDDNPRGSWRKTADDSGASWV